jgi:hypothetical protein
VFVGTRLDLLTSWCKWTGDPLPEARHRIRALYEAGLLPTRAQPLNYTHLASALLGFVAPTQHLGAAAVVKRFSAFQFGGGAIRGGTEEASAPLTALSQKLHQGTLLEAIITVLRPDYWLASLEVHDPRSWCVLTVVPPSQNNGWLDAEIGAIDARFVICPGAVEATFLFRGVASPPSKATETAALPVRQIRVIDFPLISHLLHDLMDHSLPPGIGPTESAAPARAALAVNEPILDTHARGSDRLNSSNHNRDGCVSQPHTEIPDG